MVELTRTVRFAINDESSTSAAAQQPANTFAGFPSSRGLSRHYELDVTCRGEVDPLTGYFVNIKEIDQAVRKAALPLIAAACRDAPTRDPAFVLAEILAPLDRALSGSLRRLRWRVTPYYSIEMQLPSHTSASRPPVALLRQQFEFAASHRLHSIHLTDEQNRATYGKCNNPGGHGHNYRVEPCVAVPVEANASTLPFSLADLERLTSELIIQRFDHKHLNADTAEFACGPGAGGVNPSVENIAKVCFDLLAPAIASAKGGAALRFVTVWETDKTSCVYPAES